MGSNRRDFPKPRCCENIQKFPIVYASADGIWNDESGEAVVEEPLTIRWRFSTAFNFDFLHAFGYETDYSKIPEPTVCPFCGTNLPKFRERNPVPEPICRSNQYYCLTCNERLMNCECLAPEIRWEVEP